ncbi:MAG: hypothetical protein HQM13_14015 [SAR324 cluster bacterium]|nr:hypothetical protein [SAR324 cluster bacterium]
MHKGFFTENESHSDSGADIFYNSFFAKLSIGIVMCWDKAATIRYFQTHVGQNISIKEKTSRIVLKGKLGELEELDLCSSILIESSLQLKSAGLSVALTLHDDFLGVHLMSTTPDSEDPEVSFPYQISYQNLIVEENS